MTFQRSYRRWWRHPHSAPSSYIYKVKRRYLIAMEQKYRALKASRELEFE